MSNLSVQLAGCIILDPQGRLLLMHRHTPERTQWETPGGTIDPGEEPEFTAVRELKEELGVDVEIVRELGRQDFTEDEKGMSYAWYLSKIVGGEVELLEPLWYDEFRYFSWDEAKAMNDLLSANAKNLIAAYFAKEFVL